MEKQADPRRDPQAEVVREYDPADCITPDDNRVVHDAELDDLLPSMRSQGQLVPGIVCPIPSQPGKVLVVAGARRKRCCELAGISFKAVLIDRPLSRAEIIRIRVKENVLRRNPKPFELCQEVCDYKAERGLQTWLEVGEELGLLPTAMSRITSVRHVPAELRPQAELVCPSVCWVIASLKNVDAMRRAFAFATAGGPDGIPSRDAVLRFITSLKSKKAAPAPKVRLLKGKVEGRPLQIGILPGESTDAVVEWLRSVAAKMAKYRDLPPDSLAFLFS